VEEGLSAPWSESKGFSVGESIYSLQTVHELFNPPSKPGGDQFVGHSFGPIRVRGTRRFSSAIEFSIRTNCPRKARWGSNPLPSNYFHVREVKGKYLMLSAPLSSIRRSEGRT
jgi:hypothetical protein